MTLRYNPRSPAAHAGDNIESKGRTAMLLIRKSAVLGIAASLAAVSGAPHAQEWPNKPIRMLVGFPAGGPTDVVARLVSEKLAGQVNQRIVIDNRPGAAGNIAVEILAKATPDGHTLLYSSNAIALSPGLYSKLGYDP
jgi:tripartite-type tricarboxylate transporter receptor subunit TctC